MPKRYKYCAHCGRELGDTFLKVMDNFLIYNYFDDNNNVFCSEECICANIMVEELDNEM